MTILDRTGLDDTATDTGSDTALDKSAQDKSGQDKSEWQKSACILCECNCGIEIRLGPDGRTFDRVRGDKDHPASQGYTCEKALRLDHYQNGRGERVLNPLRRRDDGTFEEVDWDTAAREVAERLGAVRDEFGGDKILYYGGGGQGNHLGGAYGAALHKGFGGRFRSSAIAQEKSGEIWVNGAMFGNAVRGEFDECEVAFFVGKNPWMSHGIPHARTTLKAIANDEDRSMVVIDPRVTETAELADFHLQVRPGRDAWLLAAMVAIIVQERLTADAWLGEHASGLDAVNDRFSTIDVAEYCAISGVDEDLVRRATRRLARASSVAAFEDLGIQMNRHSTLVSYLEKLVWTLTGNFANHGGQQIPSTMVPLVKAFSAELDAERAPRTPVAGERMFGGLVPCNVIPEEILTDHPDRYRALIVESGNPAHSVADSARMREALQALDFVLVIDVFMTETARQADYVLPATTQFEKFEATFFNFEFPKNVFHLRRPIVEPPAGPLAEPEIHARILEAAGMITEADVEPLRAAAERGRAEFAEAFVAAVAGKPSLGPVAVGPPVPHARPDPAARCRGRRRAVGCGATMHADEPNRCGARRLRHRPGSGRPAVRRDPGEPVGSGDHRRRAGRHMATPRHTRSRGASRDPRAARRARCARRPAGLQRGVAVPAVGRGAPLVHRQHDLPRPGVAQARRAGRAAHRHRRRGTPRVVRRRSRPHRDGTG